MVNSVSSIRLLCRFKCQSTGNTIGPISAYCVKLELLVQELLIQI